jgi:ABC-2 type transport system ATP-binding protein
VIVESFDVVDEPLRAREQLGYMPENSPCYPELRVAEYLRFRAECKRVPAKRRNAAVARALELANLSHRQDSVIGGLSKGYHQRLGLADALVADPPLLILDEPTSGLDPNQIREVRQVIRGLAEQHTVLLSTHILAEVEVSCDRAIVVHEGKLVAEGSLDELRGLGKAQEGTLLLRPAMNADTSGSLGELLVDRVTLEVESGGLERWHVRLPAGHASMERWVAGLVAAGYGVVEARLGRPNLEQVFAQLTQAGAADAENTAGDAEPR